VDGRERSKAFPTKAQAERLRSLLVHAHHRGEHFDEFTGQPVSWLPQAIDIQVHLWARRWLEEQWPDWQPRTRKSAIEAIARLIPLLVPSTSASPPSGLRAHLVVTLRPDAAAPTPDSPERWLDRWCLQLGQLNRALLADVDRRLAIGDNGQPLSASTAARFRKVSRACIRRAVELEILPADPWPPAPSGRSRRKSTRSKKPIDIRRLPDPPTMAAAIAAIASHQPASRRYQVMTAVAYYGGLRPSEVVMLRASCLQLPAAGWGRIDIREADVSFDEPGEPKSGPRSVPIPPPLIRILREWRDTNGFDTDDLIFRTRTGSRPTESNWARAWKRGLRQVGHPPLRLYDCRHAAATTWLRAGVPLGEAARRLGHSVETLVSTYVGALVGDEALANERIEAVLETDEAEAD
jgi:integrase